MTVSVDEFFEEYVGAFNRSLGDQVDVDAIRAQFSECFVAAGPGGVRCGANDDEFARTLQQGYEFYTSIGTKAMALRQVTTTPIDDGHQMAKVDYRASYEKSSGEQIDIDFSVTYLLAAHEDSYQIFAFISGDEMALYHQYGLLEGGTPTPNE